MKNWTDDEIKAVREGNVPEGRTYAQAAAYAHAHGIPWKELRAKKSKWFWSDTEKEMLAHDEVPPGRTEAACIQARRIFGIKVEKSKPYSRDEVREAAAGRGAIPERKLERLCKQMGVSLLVDKLPKDSKRRLRAEALAKGQSYVRKQFLKPMTRGEFVWLMHESGLSYHEIGRRLSITGTRAQSLAAAYEDKKI